jgi:hypothetical protein
MAQRLLIARALMHRPQVLFRIIAGLVILPLGELCWFQVVTLCNPLTYVSEGMRGALTAAPHLGSGWIALGLVCRSGCSSGARSTERQAPDEGAERGALTGCSSTAATARATSARMPGGNVLPAMRWRRAAP